MKKGVRMPLGLIKDYDKEWPEWFKTIKNTIQPDIQDDFLSIEHVGSTSIIGMNAKPVIDIDIIIKKEKFSNVKIKLEKLGYLHQGDLNITGREVFKLADGEKKKNLPEHHLYVCYEGEFELIKHLAFREYMKKNENDRKRLIELKKELEQSCKTRQEYIEKKDRLVQEITTRALSTYDEI